LIAARCYGGFYGEAAAFAEERGIRFVGVPVGTHKKHTTGKGNADKEATVAAIQRAGFVNVTDDNEADALSVLLTISESELLASESVKLAATKKKAGTCAASRRSKTS